jgi:uncharacterized protein Yka (UPF0111/DUF47 family)
LDKILSVYQRSLYKIQHELHRLLKKTPEIEIIDLLSKHLDLCIKATDLLIQALKYKREEKQTEASKLIKEIKAAEEEADYRRREIPEPNRLIALSKTLLVVPAP